MPIFLRRHHALGSLFSVGAIAASFFLSSPSAYAGFSADSTLDTEVDGVYNVTETTVDNRTNDTYSGSTPVSDLFAGYEENTTPGATAPLGINTLIVVQLPTLAPGQFFGPGTSFSLSLTATDLPTNFGLDLYGLNGAQDSTVSTGDYFAGALDASNTLIADNLSVTPSPFTSTVDVSGQALADYFMAAYNAAGPLATTRFAVLRVSPDADATSLTNVTDEASFVRGTQTFDASPFFFLRIPSPSVNFEVLPLTVVPEAGTLPLLVAGGALLSTGGLIRSVRNRHRKQTA